MGLFSKKNEKKDESGTYWFTTIEVECPHCYHRFYLRTSEPTQRARPCKKCNMSSFEIVLGKGKGNFQVLCHYGYEQNKDVTRLSSTVLIGQNPPSKGEPREDR